MSIVRDLGDMERVGNHATSGGAAFTDATAAVGDPTSVTLTVRRPDSSTLEFAWPAPGADGLLTRESAGRFYVDIVLDQVGHWLLRLAGTGVITAAAESYLTVRRTWTI